MLGVIPALTLPGGLPAIGDWPDDVEPRALDDMIVGRQSADGWLATLPAGDRVVFTDVRDGSRLTDLRALEADGWLRVDHGPWSGLWHARPDGWLPEHGCGHHDLGAAEFHWAAEPILVDAGGPPAGASLDIARRYRSPTLHGGLSVDGVSPTPVAKGRYDAAFLQSVIGKSPSLRAEFDGASLVYEGFARLGGLTQARRRWSLDADGIIINDVLQGTGRRRVQRRLVTPLAVTREDATVSLQARAGRLKLHADAPFSLHAETGWTVHGEMMPLTVITLTADVNLPWQGRLSLARTGA